MTQVHHRQTSLKRFRDPYIIGQQLALLAHAKKSLILSRHAKAKHNRYEWSDYGVYKEGGLCFDVTVADELAIKSGLIFAALLAKANDENVFEIVINPSYEVTKLALRIDLPTSPNTDIVLVLAGELETDRLEYRNVQLVTWYFNQKGDDHSTLKKERYNRV